MRYGGKLGGDQRGCGGESDGQSILRRGNQLLELLQFVLVPLEPVRKLNLFEPG